MSNITIRLDSTLKFHRHLTESQIQIKVVKDINKYATSGIVTVYVIGKILFAAASVSKVIKKLKLVGKIELKFDGKTVVASLNILH